MAKATKGHFGRLRSVTDSAAYARLPGAAAKLWTLYLKHADAEGVAFPGQELLAAKMGHKSDTHVGRLRKVLEAHGLLEVVEKGNGRGHPYKIRLLIPDPDAGPVKVAKKVAKDATFKDRKGCVSGAGKVADSAPKGCVSGASLNKEEQPKNSPLEQPNVARPAPRRAPATAQAELVEHFLGGWAKRYGGRYHARPVDYAKAVELLKANDGSIEDAKRSIDRYLADDWPACNRHAFAIMLGASMLPRYLGDLSPPPSNGKRAEFMQRVKQIMQEQAT